MTDREAFIALFRRMDEIISRIPAHYEDIIGLDGKVLDKAWRFFYNEITREGGRQNDR